MAKKIIIISAIVAAIMLGGTGCTMNRLYKDNRLAIERGLKYMQEKYGEEFTRVAPYGDSMSGTKEFLVTCASLPGEEILVQIENYRTDDPIFRDNYLAVKYRSQVIDILKKSAAVQGANVNVHYEVRMDGQSENLSANATFEEFLLDGRAQTVAMIEMKASEYVDRAQIERIGQGCTTNNSNMNLLIVVVDDEVFGTMNRSELNSFIGTGRCVTRVNSYIRDCTITFDWHDEE